MVFFGTFGRRGWRKYFAQVGRLASYLGLTSEIFGRIIVSELGARRSKSGDVSFSAKKTADKMASKLEYRQIKGRDEEIPVFRNLSRSVVKRGAGKIYWRMKGTEEKGIGCWDDVVWLDCETGDICFGDRFVREGWSDVYDDEIENAKRWDEKSDEYKYPSRIAYKPPYFSQPDFFTPSCPQPSWNPFDKEFRYSDEPYAYRGARKCWDASVHVWPLGVLNEWRGPVDEIEPRLAARLAEAAEFNFGLGFDGPEETADDDAFLKNANEIVRFYEAREAFRRKKAEEERENAEDDEDENEFEYWANEAFEDWRAEEKANEENDENRFDYWSNDEFAALEKGKYVPKKKKPTNKKKDANESEETDESDIPIYWNAAEVKKFWRFCRDGEVVYEEPLKVYFWCSSLKLGKDFEEYLKERRKETEAYLVRSKSEERRRALTRWFDFYGNWWSSNERPVFLGTLKFGRRREGRNVRANGAAEERRVGKRRNCFRLRSGTFGRVFGRLARAASGVNRFPLRLLPRLFRFGEDRLRRHRRGVGSRNEKARSLGFARLRYDGALRGAAGERSELVEFGKGRRFLRA